MSWAQAEGKEWALIAENRFSGSYGGTAVSGWQERTLNTIVANEIGASFNSTTGRITLPPGKYHLKVAAAAMCVNANAIEVLGNGNLIATGTIQYAGIDDWCTTYSVADALIELATDTEISINHWCQSGRINYGFGIGLTAIQGINLRMLARRL